MEHIIILCILYINLSPVIDILAISYVIVSVLDCSHLNILHFNLIFIVFSLLPFSKI